MGVMLGLSCLSIHSLYNYDDNQDLLVFCFKPFRFIHLIRGKIWCHAIVVRTVNGKGFCIDDQPCSVQYIAVTIVHHWSMETVSNHLAFSYIVLHCSIDATFSQQKAKLYFGKKLNCILRVRQTWDSSCRAIVCAEKKVYLCVLQLEQSHISAILLFFSKSSFFLKSKIHDYFNIFYCRLMRKVDLLPGSFLLCTPIPRYYTHGAAIFVCTVLYLRPRCHAILTQRTLTMRFW